MSWRARAAATTEFMKPLEVRAPDGPSSARLSVSPAIRAFTQARPGVTVLTRFGLQTSLGFDNHRNRIMWNGTPGDAEGDDEDDLVRGLSQLVHSA